MNAIAAERGYDSAAVVARGLFGFAVCFWVPLLISGIMLAAAPQSPDESYAQIQRAIAIGTGIAAALTLALPLWTFRLENDRRMMLARSVISLLGPRWMSLISCALLVEVNIVALLLLQDIAPSITGAFRLILFCWTLLFCGLLLTIHWRAVRRQYQLIRDPVAVTGIVTLMLAIVAALFLATNLLASSAGIRERLRGSLDYRQLKFIDADESPSAQAYWAEKAGTRARWLPYSYWTLAPMSGEFINIDETGLRRSWRSPADGNAPRVTFYGGSTMWGYGARDDFTIPSQVAKLLLGEGDPALVTNFAQEGYVSTQDLILFQLQLAQGAVPTVAVFYHGFNDVYSAYLRGLAGVTLRENHQVSDVEAGRLLRRGIPVLRSPSVDISEYDWSLVASAGNSAHLIVERWLGNRRLIRAIAAEFGVRVLFVWQPALFAKQFPTDTEARILSDLDRDRPGFVQLYRDVDGLIRQRAQDEAWGDFVLLTDMFAASADDVFFDLVHVNEIGNLQVAEALLGPIASALARFR